MNHHPVHTPVQFRHAFRLRLVFIRCDYEHIGHRQRMNVLIGDFPGRNRSLRNLGRLKCNIFTIAAILSAKTRGSAVKRKPDPHRSSRIGNVPYYSRGRTTRHFNYGTRRRA